MKIKFKSFNLLTVLVVLFIFAQTIEAQTAASFAISNIREANITETSAQILWETNQPATGNKVEYGIGSFGQSSSVSCSSDNLGTSHCIQLDGLEPGETYTYKITSKSSLDGSSKTSDSKSFTTTGNKAPIVDTSSPTAPANLVAVVISSSRIDLSWNNSTDNVGVAGYKVYVNGQQFTTTDSTSYSHINLSAGTKYSYVVSAYDARGNESAMSNVASATTSSSDTTDDQNTNQTTVNDRTSPSVPTGLSGRAISSKEIFLSWSPSTDNVGVTGYIVRRNGTNLATIASTSLNDNNLAPSTSYTYSVAARDSAGNISNFSAEITIITMAADARIVISGVVRLPDGSPAVGAFISAWSSSGESKYMESGTSGQYSFEVAKNSTWYLRAHYNVGEEVYSSSGISISVAEASSTGIELALVKQSSRMPPSEVTQKPTNEQASLTLSNRAAVVVPPSAVTYSGNITLLVRPTTEVPETRQSRVVGFAYDITITDQNGVEIKSFAKPLDITLPFDDATLAALGVTVEALAPSYFNTATNAWVKIPNFTLDRVNKLIIAHVTHLTRFAIIGAADITPPPAPTGLKATKVGSDILLTWTNPLNDFRHAKVYRSTEAGKLGTVVFAEVFENSKLDTTINPGRAYYYTVRTVDPAGNESINTTQVTVAPFGQIVSSLNRYLRRGFSGADVTLLQQILIKEGVYPEALVTGYFGPLTHAAVIRLQEKYKSEILAPFNMSKGNGFVGPKTKAKVEELKAKHSL